MARPQKNGLDYFPHDVDASSDEKIEALRTLYGNDGYAFYFILLERIYRTSDAELDISDAETIQILARKIGIDVEMFKNILSTALNHKCFDRKIYDKRGVLTSEGIKKRVAIVDKKRQNMRDNYNRRKGVSAAETPPETSQKLTSNESETPQIKEKKSKVNKIKENKNIYSDDFEKFYTVYPRSEDKHRTFTNWKTCLKNYTVDQLMAACENYKAAKKGKDIEFIKSSANFLGKEKPFEDYINYKPQQTQDHYRRVD